jgi:hypothetical protein
LNEPSKVKRFPTPAEQVEQLDRILDFGRPEDWREKKDSKEEKESDSA